MTKTSTSKRQNLTAAETIRDAKAFRRALHSKGNLLKGLGDARLLLSPAAVPEIVSVIAQTSLYRKVIAREPFPAAFENLKLKRPLPPAPDKVEALWTAAILNLYTDQLAQYVSERNDFFRAICAGDYDLATHKLDSIENAFGMSLWLLSNRITLLQIAQGTSAQKAFLQSIINRKGIHPLIAYLAYLFSYTAEENVSLAELSREWNRQETAKLSDGSIQFIRYHINPFDLSGITEPWRCVAHEENSSAIDRFETFVEMAQLALIRADDLSDLGYLGTAIEGLSGIGDIRISNLLTLLRRSDSAFQAPAAYLSCSDILVTPNDAALAADLQSNLDMHPEKAPLYEIAARASLKAGHIFRISGDGAAANGIIENLQEVFGLTEKYHQSRFSLQKSALLLRKQPISRFILSFLEKSDDRDISQRAHESEAVWALSHEIRDPAEFPILKRIAGDAILPAADSMATCSAYATLTKAVAFPSNNSAHAIEASAASVEYKELYLGHLAYNNENYHVALAHYKAFQSRSGGAEAARTARAIYKAARALEELDQFLNIFTEAYLQNEAVHLAFPLDDIVSWATENAAADCTALNRSILLTAYSLHISTKFDGELSDAFEDVLDFFGVLRPAELLELLGNGGALESRIIFFLQHVCTIRRMEDCTRFNAYEEIEAERLSILTNLCEKFPELSSALSAEIVEVTKEREVAQLTEQFDRSRIYVNETGVKRFIDVELADAVARYRRLLDLPDLEFQVIGLEELIRKILKAAGGDYGDISPPATERNGLLLGIHDLVMDAFVLNPDHGLETYLRTRILHGSIEGELRSSFTKHRILFSTDGDDFDGAWRQKLAINAHDLATIKALLARFSKRVSDSITELKDQRVRVKSSRTPKGLLDFEPTPEELWNLQVEVNQLTTSDEVADAVIRHLWRKVEQSLAAIRKEVDLTFRKRVTSAMESLKTGLAPLSAKGDLNLLGDAITQASTEFQQSLEKVASWFQRTGSAAIKPFSVATAVQVAVKITNSRFPTKPIAPEVMSEHSGSIRGSAFMPLVDILTNCFQNAIEHARFDGRAPATKVTCGSTDGFITIKVENELRDDCDIASLRTAVERHLDRGHAAASKITEGRGTGLKEIIRILSREAKGAGMSAAVLEERKFVVKFSLPEEQR